MNQIIFSLLLFCLTVSGIYAQDKIITIKPDTLSCSIDSISEGKMHYSFIIDNSKVNNYIPLEEVSAIYYKGDYILLNGIEQLNIEERINSNTTIVSESWKEAENKPRSLVMLKPEDPMPLASRMELSGYYLKKANNARITAFVTTVATSLLVAASSEPESRISIGLVGGGLSLGSWISSLSRERKAAKYLNEAYQK